MIGEHGLQPYLLGQIGLVGNPIISPFSTLSAKTLPIRSNRISWKHQSDLVVVCEKPPYLLGQIGLVGNNILLAKARLVRKKQPYLLGQIGLVGNP